MHGRVGLQCGQTQVAALGFEGHGVGDDGANPKASVQLAVINVSILAQVDVEHAIESEEEHNRKGHFQPLQQRRHPLAAKMLSQHPLINVKNSQYLRLCRWPMKLDGMLETNLRSVMVPVSMLWNSSRVWSPTIWPGDGEGGGEGLKKKTKNKKKREHCLTLTQKG